MAVMETFTAPVAVGNHVLGAPRRAAVIAEFAHNVQTPVAADVVIAAMPVIDNGQQSPVMQLYNGGNAVIMPGIHVGVKHVDWLLRTSM